MNPGESFELLLIRHAESANNAKPVYERVCDPPITPRGRLQADHLATWMHSLPLDVLVTSPFRRTLETSYPILKRRACPVQVWHDVFENGGCYHGHDVKSFVGAEGMNRRQIERFFQPQPALAGVSVGTQDPASISGDTSAGEDGLDDRFSLTIDDEIGDAGWWACRPREESDETKLRATQVAERLVETFGGTRLSVALVIHADFKRELLRVLLKDILCMDSVGAIANTSVTMLRGSSEGVWQLGSLNSVTHVPPRLITGRES
ncbi:2,3-bisphosphoglycerate-dependent phosphoglycerate mutase [Rhodopirellula rubra]|uniref:2,3-bisphosphoglycerate-dependent phosphoglycerate mutase n=1 Tax=Aporhodopirellula rubra TaxID=980271 RepID=A0A7W5H6N9_9BACT|nr:histidine phosphatase family protein [Aporhodopirellula rubra]MBB3207684.1 2,3-bisphosphoglycerate-dependent phosphoglycerate mutase [Aporhodopirellula rubra]